MPPGSVAPLAFYFQGDLLGDYSNLELIGTISTMEAFQKIYRPEIYNANSVAGKVYQPSLKHQDSSTRIVYDREERSQLAVKQGRFTEEHFIKPYRAVLEQWPPADPSISHSPPGHTTRCRRRRCSPPPPQAACPNPPGWPSPRSSGHPGSCRTKA